MKIPPNFTRGDISDKLFREVFELASNGKSKFSIVQRLVQDGIPKTVAEKHSEEILKLGKRERSRAKRPHRIIGWCVLLIGVAATIGTLIIGEYVIYAVSPICFGVYWILHNRD